MIGLIGGALIGAKHRDRVNELHRQAEEFAAEEARILAEAAKKRARRSKSKDSGSPE